MNNNPLAQENNESKIIIIRTAEGKAYKIDPIFLEIYSSPLFDLLLPAIFHHHEIDCAAHLAKQSHDNLKAIYYNRGFDNQIIIPNTLLRPNDIIRINYEYIAKITKIIIAYKILIHTKFRQSVITADLPLLNKLTHIYIGICTITSMLYFSNAIMLIGTTLDNHLTLEQQYSNLTSVFNYTNRAISIIFSVMPANEILAVSTLDNSFLMSLLNSYLFSLLSTKKIITHNFNNGYPQSTPHLMTQLEDIPATIKYINDAIDLSHRRLNFDNDIIACDYLLTHKLNLLQNICYTNEDPDICNVLEECMEQLSRQLLLFLIRYPQLLIKHVTKINILLSLSLKNAIKTINNVNLPAYDFFTKEEHTNKHTLVNLTKYHNHILKFLTKFQQIEHLHNKHGILIYHLILYTKNINNWPTAIRDCFAIDQLKEQSQLCELNFGLTKNNMIYYKSLSSTIHYCVKEAFFNLFHHTLMQTIQPDINNHKIGVNTTNQLKQIIINLYQELLSFQQINIYPINTDDELNDYFDACYLNTSRHKITDELVNLIRNTFKAILAKCFDAINQASVNKSFRSLAILNLFISILYLYYADKLLTPLESRYKKIKFSAEMFPIDYMAIPKFYDEYIELMSQSSIYLQESYKHSCKYIPTFCSVQTNLLLHIHRTLQIHITDLSCVINDIYIKSLHLISRYSPDQDTQDSNNEINIKAINPIICNYFHLLNNAVPRLQNTMQNFPSHEVQNLIQQSISDIINTIPKLRAVNAKMTKLEGRYKPLSKRNAAEDTKENLPSISSNQNQLFFKTRNIKSETQQVTVTIRKPLTPC